MAAPDEPALSAADPDQVDTAGARLAKLAAQLRAAAVQLYQLAGKSTTDIGQSAGWVRVLATARRMDSVAADLLNDVIWMQQRSAGQRRASAAGPQQPGRPGRRRRLTDRNGAALDEKVRDTFFSFELDARSTPA